MSTWSLTKVPNTSVVWSSCRTASSWNQKEKDSTFHWSSVLTMMHAVNSEWIRWVLHEFWPSQSSELSLWAANTTLTLRSVPQSQSSNKQATSVVQNPNFTSRYQTTQTSAQTNGTVKADRCPNYLTSQNARAHQNCTKVRTQTHLTITYHSKVMSTVDQTYFRRKCTSKDTINWKKSTKSKPNWQKPS